MMRNLYLVLALCLFFPAGLFAQADTLQTVVYFDVGQSTLRADARARLDALLQRRGDADWVRVEFTGRTDHDGDLAANLRLAKRRIASVQAYLNEKGGLAADICGSWQKGEADPLADNVTPAGKSINRSVRIDCQVRRQPAVTSIPSASLSDAVPLAQLLDTVKVNSIPCYDANCQRDTTIVLPQGTRLVFNRCEYLQLQPCLEFEEALSARDAMAQGLNTVDSLGQTLESCGMIRITLRPGCVNYDCFKYPILVKTPVPQKDCNSCVAPPTLYEITQALTWRRSSKESPKIEIVKDKGREYYQYSLRCPGGWINCDCLSKGKRIKVKAPRGYEIQTATLNMDCPTIVISSRNFHRKRLNIVRFRIPCPKSEVYLDYSLVDPLGKMQVVERKPFEKLRAKKPIRGCDKRRGKRIRRVLGIFPVYRHALYHKYFLVAKKDRIRR